MASNKKTPPATLPSDLCSPSQIAAGFALLEPINSVASTMLSAADLGASPKTLAADSIAHLVEGWRYLASAIYGFLAHATGPSIHQAYYAELRAAFSLFAASGIAIRKPNHEYIASNGARRFPPWQKGPTHTVAWQLWKQWANSVAAETLFSDGLKIHPMVTLRDLQQNLQALTPAASLKAWGFDLVTLKDDHNARNMASYEPYWGQAPLTAMSGDDFVFVTELWQQLQPAPAGLQFEISLVHFVIDVQLDQERAANPKFDASQWYATLVSGINSATGAPMGELLQLLQERPFSRRPFVVASDTHSAAMNVLSRALFLLRLATVAVERNFIAFPASSGKEWLKKWLVHAGVWNDSAVAAPADIWADFEDLPQATSPGVPLPFNLFNDNPVVTSFGRMLRPDAAVAWSIHL